MQHETVPDPNWMFLDLILGRGEWWKCMKGSQGDGDQDEDKDNEDDDNADETLVTMLKRIV